MINIDRLWDRIEELSNIGRTPDNGVTRFSYTPAEHDANELVKSYMQLAGLDVSYDTVGNLIGTKYGTEGLSAILLGSHIDTVPNGGKFDGSLGVLTAIEVMHSLQDQNITLKHPVKVIAFKDEEGSRFGFGMIGSRAVAGTLTDQDLDMKDVEGISIRKALMEQGFEPKNIHSSKIDNVKMYLELHIEQGKVLENHHTPVGIVTGIAGPLWLKFKLAGEAEHAGATPMGQRKDPLVAASLIISEIEKIASKYSDAVATVGSLSVTPGGINVIPGTVEFTVDIRDINEQLRDCLEKEIKDYAAKIVNERNIKMTIEELQRVSPVLCSQDIQNAIKQSVYELDYPNIWLPSGAGHDAMQFKDIFPLGMIFVRSKDGLSHNPKEFTAKEDVKAGAEIMLNTLVKLDKA
jgi:allantoate deiminase